jgi:SAM-dependent methyltransferase
LREVIDLFLRPAMARRRPQRILVLSGEPENCPDLHGLASRGVVRLDASGAAAAGAVCCNRAELPFQDSSFDAVVMHHVLSDGSEPELGEAERILTAGGEIFVLGRGRLGLVGRFGRPRNDLPRLWVGRMCRSLREHSFRIEQCVGMGLAGVRVNCDRRWQQPALPFADAVLIRGRHRAVDPIVTPLRFNRPQTVGVQSAAADSLSREAV